MRPFALLAAFVLALTACSKSEPVAEKIPARAETSETPDKQESVKKYQLHGEVIRVDPHGQIATIKHQPIGDWMGAMTMDFPVKSDADFAKLTPGKPVEATVNVQGGLEYWIGDVK
jgi:Cu/Ag efflux protein CusF